eukprot:2620531-Rhodomonas_salina.1
MPTQSRERRTSLDLIAALPDNIGDRRTSLEKIHDLPDNVADETDNVADEAGAPATLDAKLCASSPEVVGDVRVGN